MNKELIKDLIVSAASYLTVGVLVFGGAFVGVLLGKLFINTVVFAWNLV
jgi:hypothetical protein